MALLTVMFFCLFFPTHQKGFEIVDCDGCGRFEQDPDETCTLRGKKGVSYSRRITHKDNCKAQDCPARVCDITGKCSGIVNPGICDESCSQKSHVFYKVGYNDECVVTIMSNDCLGGKCPMDLKLYSPAPVNLGEPVEVYDCSGCGPWVWVGWCREDGQPPGRYNWRNHHSDDCPEVCGDFACDPTPIFDPELMAKCEGRYVEEQCRKDCKQKFRRWTINENGDCQDTVEYLPCYTHKKCWIENGEGPGNIQLLRSQNGDPGLINNILSPGNVQLLRKGSEGDGGHASEWKWDGSKNEH